MKIRSHCMMITLHLYVHSTRTPTHRHQLYMGDTRQEPVEKMDSTVCVPLMEAYWAMFNALNCISTQCPSDISLPPSPLLREVTRLILTGIGLTLKKKHWGWIHVFVPAPKNRADGPLCSQFRMQSSEEMFFSAKLLFSVFVSCYLFCFQQELVIIGQDMLG